ncbi:MAG TPA: MFS transporter [Bacteroidia bacterium]|nr:MFS transporter [Bacteroidia bacterium]
MIELQQQAQQHPQTNPNPKRFSMILKESSLTRYFAFSVLYFGQGVPEGITFGAIPAWLVMQGASSGDVASYVATIGLPWSFKIFIAPMMDRHSILSMGRKRPWVIFGQLGLILSFISLSLIHNPVKDLSFLMALGFIISMFGCFQDVATDGMAVDIIPSKEQARANGLMWGSKVMGYSATLAAGSYLMNKEGFSMGVLIPALFTTIIICIPLFFRERRGEKLLPWTEGAVSPEVISIQVASFKKMMKNLVHVFLLPSSLVLAVIGIMIGFIRGSTDVVFPLFTIQKLGWLNTDFANLSSSAYIIGGAAGMLIGGYLVDKFGRGKMLFIYLSVLLTISGIFMCYNSFWFTGDLAAWLIGLTTAFIVFTNIAYFASCMEHCWLRVSATQFTLYMAISNVGMSVGSAIIGIIHETFGWLQVFGFMALTLGVAIVLIRFLTVKSHRQKVDELESNECLILEVATQSSRM